jgi:calcineurin-like phosphoesterase family protein
MDRLLLPDNARVWVSSDWHFLHKNISGPDKSEWKDGYRDFKDEYEMTDHIINEINTWVKEDDVIIFLGDFSFKDHRKIPELRARIACKTIYVIAGNHDTHLNKYASCFTAIRDKLDVMYRGDHYICDHYAHRVWLGSQKGYYHLYAHSHDSLDRPPNQPWGKSMDVGIDAARRITGLYRPFSLAETKAILDKRDTKIVDHHNSETNIR